MNHVYLFLLAVSVLIFTNPVKATEHNASVVLAGGCFWCIESDFDKLNGVTSTTSGYTGGTIKNPTYQNYNDKGPNIVPHIEVVKIEYNTTKITYAAVLDYYFYHIDPTDGDGQFCDRGPSYRPVIFFDGKKELMLAMAAKQKTAKSLGKPLAVELFPATVFWKAEPYHQNYHSKNLAKYKFYRWNCGRDQKIKELWSKK